MLNERESTGVEPFSDDLNSLGTEENIKVNSTKKGLLIVFVAILLIVIAVGIILFVVLSSKPEENQQPPQPPQPNPEEKKEIKNLILSKFVVEDITKQIKIYHQSYNNTISSLEVDNNAVKINYTIPSYIFIH